MKIYKLQLTALSPIHIGTGEDYEPTNYLIDKMKVKISEDKIVENDYMFIFDDMELYKNLSKENQEEFDRIVLDLSADSRFKLYSLIVKNKDVAKKISTHKIQVLPSIAKDYYEKIGKVVQKESRGKNVFNQFTIAKTYISPNTRKPVLLGSSLKGSISTAYQENIFNQLKDYNEVEKLMMKPTKENIFRNVSIGDANAIKQGTFIGEAINKKRNKETRDIDDGVKVRLQAILNQSEFQTTISIKNELDFNDIIKSCNDHYLPLFQSQFNHQTDEYTRKAFSDKFVSTYEDFKLNKNQFLLRVGKYSGARAVTVDGIRRIKIMQGRNNPPKYSDEETTFWSINKLPFGWLLCELVD